MKTYKMMTSATGKGVETNQTRIHTAVIFSPSEVEFKFRRFEEAVQEKMRGRWMLLGAVSENLYSRLEANAGNDIVAQLVVLPIPSGAKYTVLTCQLGNLQHRFVLPMYEPKVADMLTNAIMTPLSIYFESTSQVTMGIVYNCPLQPVKFKQARSECQIVSVDEKNDCIIEFPSVVSALSSIEMVPSLNREPVLDVEASFYLPRPEVITEQTKAAIYQASGR